MLERYSDRARMAMAFANWYAQQREGTCIELHDVIAGILIEEVGVGLHALNQLGVSNQVLRETLNVHELRSNFTKPQHKLPLAKSTKRLVSLAIRQCRVLNHNGVGTEHLLLAWLESDDKTASEFLQTASISIEKIRDQIIDILDGARDKKPSILMQLLKKISKQ